MKKLMSLTIVLLTLVLLSSSVMNAQGRGKRTKRGFGQKGMQFKMMEKLNLTDTQKDKMKQIRFENEEKKIDLQASIKKQHLAMKKLIESGDFDRSEILSISDKISDLKNDMHKLMLNGWLDVYELLDDSQKEVFKRSFPRAGMKGGNEGRGRRGHRGFGMAPCGPGPQAPADATD